MSDETINYGAEQRITKARALIRTWTDKFGELPEPLKSVAETWEALAAVPTDKPVIPSADKITVKNAGKLVTDLAAAKATSDKLFISRNLLLAELAPTILQAASDSVPTVMEGMRPGFEQAVEHYTAAAAKLPEKLTYRNVVDYGLGVEFQNAVDAAKRIETVQKVLSGFIELPGYACKQLDSPLPYVLQFPSAESFRKAIDAGKNTHQQDEAEKQVKFNYLTAVREGATFQMSTPAEAGRQIKQLDAEWHELMQARKQQARKSA